MTPKVYFTDFCTVNSETLPQKLARLIMQAGLDQIDFQDKFVAIKIHFGELGNMAHLRPGYAKVLVVEINLDKAIPNSSTLSSSFPYLG